MKIDLKLYQEYALKIFGIDSPSGYTDPCIFAIKKICTDLGFECVVTNKGNLKIVVEGKDNSKVVATSAHVDTLGLMVRSISSNGTLKVTKLGGPQMPTLDGEYCTILTRDQKKYTGTILSTSPSSHVYEDAAKKVRDIDNMEIRLDEIVNSSADVRKLGIDNGDFVFVDPKTTFTTQGFLKSRFIDDKASVVCLMVLLHMISKKEIYLKNKTIFYFVTHEEVGHGASDIDDEISEFVTVDMGCIGLDLAGNEYAVSIAAKDSNGPYDYELTTRLVNLAKANDLKYVVDIFPFYGSDIGAAWHAGHDFKGALIGPGVSASHGMERTHLQAIENTIKLIALYLGDKAK